MNSKNSKTSDPNRLVLNLPDKIDLRRDNECIDFSNLSMYYRLENIKKLYKTINSQISDPNWNEKLVFYKKHEIYLITYQYVQTELKLED